MPSPFHQKYSSQTHKWFETQTTPAMPEGPKEDPSRRTSTASSSGAYSPERRRSSAANRYETFKRPSDADHLSRRASLQDSYAKPGYFATMWNNYVRGPTVPPAAMNKKEERDITTLRS